MKIFRVIGVIMFCLILGFIILSYFQRKSIDNQKLKTAKYQISNLEYQLKKYENNIRLGIRFNGLSVLNVFRGKSNDSSLKQIKLDSMYTSSAALLYLNSMHCSSCVKEEVGLFVKYLNLSHMKFFFLVHKDDKQNIGTFLKGLGFENNILWLNEKNIYPHIHNKLPAPTAIITDENSRIKKICLPSELRSPLKNFFYQNTISNNPS